MLSHQFTGRRNLPMSVIDDATSEKIRGAYTAYVDWENGGNYANPARITVVAERGNRTEIAHNGPFLYYSGSVYCNQNSPAYAYLKNYDYNYARVSDDHIVTTESAAVTTMVN